MSTGTHTLNEIMRNDLRRMRVQPLVYAILEAVRPYLADSRDERYVHDDLAKLLQEAGAEIITDQMRADLNLPPRGPDGWTNEEIIALERRRLEVMMAPMYVREPTA